MTSERPYRRRRSREETIRILEQGAGKQWDAALLERFLPLVAGADAETISERSAG